MNIVLAAEAFAKEAHKGQTYGDLPFIVHPRAVFHMLLSKEVINEDMLAAAWLHDVVEDTAHDNVEICVKFGPEVANLVHLLTDKEGRNRLARQKKTYMDIAKNPQARLIKLADRCCNVLASLHSDYNLFGMYKAEHELFKNLVYDEKECSFNRRSQELQTLLDTLIYRGRFT